ncbi:hypothetical protein Pcinc_020616 [Petrolisthes cinctipes]|uniref:Uncharacterized protein n=1 Tax=Petrolisthes cinctipes TaxID=88211 RepID=A0AAE1FHS5_PETCI|nr:hypothetical protein Pcinc_020616 [Petrolisthes cinctipes]
MGSMGLPWLLLLLVQTITVFMGEVDGTSPSLSRHHLPPPPLHNPLHLSHQNRPPSPLPVPRHYHLPPTPHNPHLSQQDPPPPPPHILSLLQQHLSSHLPRHILPARVQEHHDQLHPASLHAAWPRDVDTGMRTNRRDVEKGDRTGGKVTNYCDVCPAAHAIAPCMMNGLG